MAVCYKLKMKTHLMKKLNNMLNFQLRSEFLTLSKLMFGYNKLEEEGEEDVDIVNREGGSCLWRNSKYRQL